MEVIRQLSNIVWSEWFWLPKGQNWTVYQSTPETTYPDFYWIYLPIPFSLLLFLVRLFFERKVCDPIGRSIGVSDFRSRAPAPNATLEDAYRNRKKIPDAEQLRALSKRVDLTTRQVESWFRQRKATESLSQLQKFSETGWRFFFYTSMFVYGLWSLSSKPWFRSTDACWIGYPFHPIDRDMWWYYMIELSFYWSLLISQFTDVRRKDFWQMFTHHVTTILLLALSWTVNLIRMGSLVLIIHDVADVFLEAAKLARYANKPRLCDLFFIVFTVVWIVSRIFIYPYVVVYAAVFEACETAKCCFPAYYLFNALLICLQGLHLVWTWYIIRIAVKSIRTGKTDDARSDTDEDDEVDTHSQPERSPKSAVTKGHLHHSAANGLPQSAKSSAKF